MNNKNFLGIDIGTTSLKAAVFDGEGKRIALRNVDYTLDSDSATGCIEFDAENYADICFEVIRELKSECGEISAISVDTQGETMILTDEDGKPLCPAVVWLDNRATAEADYIREKLGNKRVYEVTGQAEISPGWPASKLLWFANNRPEIFSKIRKVFLLEDWILYKLTGNFVTEPTIQSSTIYFDITSREWWPEMLDIIGVTPGMLPKILPSGTPCGEYDGMTVVTGALDQIAGSLGVGVTDSSVLSEMTGTALVIVAVTDSIPPYEPGSVIPCHIHAIDGKYCRLLWSSTAGMCLKWFKNNLASGQSFRELDEEAAAVAPGSDGMTVLPHFCGSMMPDYAPEARASFNGVTLAHTRGHFARAIMESVAYNLRQDLEYIDVPENAEIRITGGGASGSLWPQIKADVTGRVLSTVLESETACLGCAILAAAGTGFFSSVADAASRFVGIKKHFSPSGTDYSEAYERYLRLNAAYIDSLKSK
ncbi:MAG: hypothetical protein MJ137_01475 [Clostridia bacterium]|nr:hypothetical protein [Clostridia bacterium]